MVMKKNNKKYILKNSCRFRSSLLYPIPLQVNTEILRIWLGKTNHSQHVICECSMSGTKLKASVVLTHSVLTTTYEVGTVVICILRIGKPNHGSSYSAYDH